MIPASKAAFPYPLQLGALESFCRPIDGHVLELPRWHEGEAVAGCGWFAIRASRGLWMMDGSDFEPAGGRFVERMGKLPWGSFEFLIKDEANWRPMSDFYFFKHGALALWLKGRPSPCPVWRVADSHLVRLSHLQLISRLPRVEIYVGEAAALFFRFTGGRGIIPKDPKLTVASFEVFTARRHEDGARLEHRRAPAPNFMKPPPEEPKLEDWPPVCADD